MTQQDQQHGPCYHHQHREYAKAAAKGGGKGGKSGGKQKGKDAKKGPSKPKKIRLAGNFDEKDPFNARVLAMILPPAEPRKLEMTPEELAAAEQKAKDYSRQKMAEHLQWQQRIMTAIHLRDAAVQALPAELRQAAMQEDLKPLPLSRNFYYDSPPKSYKD